MSKSSRGRARAARRSHHAQHARNDNDTLQPTMHRLRQRIRGAGVPGLLGGLPLVAIGSAMLLVTVSGDSLFYVRAGMRLPLLLTGSLVVLLGLASMIGVVVPHHVPKSAALVIIPVVFLLMVRPGPLTVDTGESYGGFGADTVRTSFAIPTSAIVGIEADLEAMEEFAVDVDPGQFLYAVEQFPERFGAVAVRVIGQLDRESDGDDVLVRFRILCCAADAIRVSLNLRGDAVFEHGAWVEIVGQWDGATDTPGLRITGIREIEQPDNPYLSL